MLAFSAAGGWVVVVVGRSLCQSESTNGSVRPLFSTDDDETTETGSGGARGRRASPYKIRMVQGWGLSFSYFLVQETGCDRSVSNSVWHFATGTG